MLTTFDHHCLEILFLRIENFSTLLFHVNFNFVLYFPTSGSKVSQLGPSLILFALKLCEIRQLSHMLRHNVIFCQYSLSHQCSHPCHSNHSLVTSAVVLRLLQFSSSIHPSSFVAIANILHNLLYIVPSPFYIQYGQSWSFLGHLHKLTFQTQVIIMLLP